MVYIYSSRTLLKAIGAIILLYLFAILITAITNRNYIDSRFLMVSILVAVVIFVTIFGFYLIYLKGRKIEITEKGINIGKKYLGPFKVKLKISAYSFPEYRESEMLISWNNIKKIHLGIWERFWARHWNILTPLLAGEKMSKPEMVAQVIGIPLKRWKGYFLIIETKKFEFYAIEMNAMMADKTKQVLKNFGKDDLLEFEKYEI